MKQKIIDRSVRVFQFCKKSHVAAKLALQILLGIFISAFCVMVLLKISDDVIQTEPISFDPVIIQSLYTLRNVQATQVMMALTFLGSAGFLFCSSLVVIFYLTQKRRKDAVIFSFILC